MKVGRKSEESQAEAIVLSLFLSLKWQHTKFKVSEAAF